MNPPLQALVFRLRARGIDEAAIDDVQVTFKNALDDRSATMAPKRETRLDVEDVASALTGVSISLVAAMKAPKHRTPNDVLEGLANEVHSLVNGMNQRTEGWTPATQIMQLVAEALMLSETRPERG